LHEKLKSIVYDKARSKESTDGAYYITNLGKMFVNTFSKEYVKLGLMRKDAINDDKSLMLLDSEMPITLDSVEDAAVTHAIETVAKLSTNQLDLTLSGIVFDYMLLLKSGFNFTDLNHKYHVVVGQKLIKTELKGGRYVFNKHDQADYESAEEELMALKGIVQNLLRTALQNSNFRSPKFAPIRMMLNAKLDLSVSDNSQSADNGQEGNAASEGAG
jgi:hypothetical protein